MGRSNNDTITDFQTDLKGEKIDLSGVGSITGLQDQKQNHLTMVDGIAVIDDGAGDAITPDGVVKADLGVNDFVF